MSSGMKKREIGPKRKNAKLKRAKREKESLCKDKNRAKNFHRKVFSETLLQFTIIFLRQRPKRKKSL